MQMRTLLAALLITTLGMTTTIDARQAPATADERALTAIVEDWTKARNANDAEAMRPLFAEKVDRVNLPTGQLESTTGDELVTYFAKGFAGPAKGTHAKTIKIRPILLSPTVGLIDHTYTMFDADGSTVGVGHTTFVATKNPGAWKVVAVRYASAWPSQRAPYDQAPPR